MALPHLLSRTALAGAVVITTAAFSVAADTAVIAKVGDLSVTAQEFAPYFAKISAEDREALEKNPAALNQIVRKLIAQQLLYKEAVANGWDKQAEVVAQLEQLKQGAIAETYLQSIAKVPENFPSQEDIEAAYQARKATLIVPRQLQVSQIYIARPPENDKAAVEKAAARVESLAKNVKQPGSDFSAIAQGVTNDPEIEGRGGELGWLAESDIQPDVRTRISTLAKGGVSEVIKLPDGWYILKVQDIKESRPATFDEVRDQLAQLLRGERQRLNREAYLAKLQQQNPVSLNELELSQLIKPRGN